MSDDTRKKIAESRWLDWLDKRFRLKQYIIDSMEHPVKPWMRKWYYCLGGLTLTMFILLVITGIILLQHYKPTTAGAAESVAFIMGDVWMGWLIRGVHHWAANLMMVLVVAHMVRVFVTGAYKNPRELNWVTGVFLLLSTLGFYVTGYTLPWDQRGFELAQGVVDLTRRIPLVGNPIAGLITSEPVVGDEALNFFYMMHVIILPLVIFILLLFHFVMIRRQGIAEPL
ncbi:MAG: DUF4405 domain-containing protein [Candidatus Coatesbacteria bacterium]|nr:DUF4405 domain-containing protein [Candidatus Coatesbacteria bacterium]